MPALDLLDWTVRAFSLFNTIALLWLGLTVLLNAERRAWGTYLAGGGLALSGLFFAGHSAIVGRIIYPLDPEMPFWWHAIWLLFISPPYMWYLVIAWYSGVLRTGRHRGPLLFLTALGVVALVLLAVAGPLPSYGAIVEGTSGGVPALGGVPLVALVYPVYSVLCVVFAIEALRRPEPSERFMGDVARQRARPWLVAAALVLLAVSLSVGAVAAWFVRGVGSRQLDVFSPDTLRLLMRFDLLISGLIAVAVVLMGRAIVSYEIFTGRALPRGGLFRHWRNSLILGAGYGVLLGASLDLPTHPIYQLMLATVLMTIFFALVSWRSYAEREQSIERLRPFVASQRLYEHLLRPAAPPAGDPAFPFRALCGDLLGARVAYLAPLGPLAPLAGPMLAYPDGAAPPEAAALAALAGRLVEPKEMCLDLDPAQYGGAVWAIPLWSDRGLIGVFLLGDKREGGLYVQEEIEIARAAGERLIDTLASVEMARRLMALQRQRMSESQVLDRRARRVLHDDILPRLHAALLALNGAPAAGTTSESVALLADVHRRIANLLQAMPAAPAPDVARLSLIGVLRRLVETELPGAFDGVTWRIEPEGERVAQAIPTLIAEVVFFAAREAMRNAARHGRAGDDARPLHLTVTVADRGGLELTVEDDGVGLVAAGTPAEGSGHGLALHGTMMAVVGGALTVESVPGARTRITLSLPHEAFPAFPAIPA